MDSLNDFTILQPSQGVLTSTGVNVPTANLLDDDDWGLGQVTNGMTQAENEVKSLKEEIEKMKERTKVEKETIKMEKETMRMEIETLKKEREAMRTLEMDNSILRKENERSRAKLQTGSRIIDPEELLETTKRQENRIIKLETAAKNQRPYAVIRAQDIPELKLEELSTFSSERKIKTFVKQVETCTTDEESRLNLATFKMDTRAAAIVGEERRKRGVDDWNGFKKLLVDLYVVPVDAGVLTQEMNTKFNYSA